MEALFSLENTTLIWIASPFLIGFSIYLLPKLARPCALLMTLFSLGYSLPLVLGDQLLKTQLVDSFGVTVQIDSLSGYFVLTNALVTAAALIYSWPSKKGAFFHTQTMILHGSVNAVFICADFISLYVAIEVIGVASFLLMTYARSDRVVWVGLRYLFISNTAMLFYLIGAALFYLSSGTFSFDGLSQASPESLTLMTLGLMTKGGVFASGLWLPQTHSEAETQVSAMLSGVVVKTGVFPLVRCALLLPELQPPLVIIGAATALLGVIYAIFEQDTKRTLALSTVSQMGFLLVNPAASGLYALSHGLAKSSLFLLAGNLPSRSFQVLRQQRLAWMPWLGLAIAALSLAGFPLLAGYGAKTLTVKPLAGASGWLMTVAAIGTATVCAKFILLPVTWTAEQGKASSLKPELKTALGVTLGALFLANGFAIAAYSFDSLLKSLIIVGLGGLIYSLWSRKVLFRLPSGVEKLDNLIGMMGLIAILVFGLFLSLPHSIAVASLPVGWSTIL